MIVGSLSADLTKSATKHDFSFGFMGAVMQDNGKNIPDTQFNFDHNFTAGPRPQRNLSGNRLRLCLASARHGLRRLNGQQLQSGGREALLGIYGQDTWKAAKNLTVNLGLRYELQNPPTERENRQAYFDYNAVNPISSAVGIAFPGELVYNGGGNRRGLYGESHSNVAPRIGFTDQITRKLVARGGYGVFFSPQYFGGGYNPGFSQSTPYVASVDGGITPYTTLSNPFPNGLIPAVGRSLGGMQDVGYSTTGIPTSRHSPYVQQYSLGIEYAFTTDDVVTASFVGNRGTHLLLGGFNHSEVNPSLVTAQNDLTQLVTNPFYGSIQSSGCGLNQPTVPKGQLLQPFPQYCGVNEPDAPMGDSLYNALLVDYNHRFHGGLNVLVSYTYSKFLDDVLGTNNWAYVGNQGVRNYYDLKAERSVDGSDIPNSLVANYIYQLPIGRKGKFATHVNKATDAVIGGWQLAGITSIKSGIPLGFGGGGNTNMWGGNQRPNLIGNPHLANRSINEWFNTAAFAAPAPYTFGNIPNFLSSVRAPGYNRWDASLQKSWNLSDKARLQGRAEFFNLPNHPSFYAPDTGITDGAFGTIRAAFGARDIQFAMKLYW